MNLSWPNWYLQVAFLVSSEVYLRHCQTSMMEYFLRKFWHKVTSEQSDRFLNMPLQLLCLYRRNSSLLYCLSFYPLYLPPSGLWGKNCQPEVRFDFGNVFQYFIFWHYLLTEISILLVLSSNIFRKQTINKQPFHDISFRSYHKQLRRI